MSEVCGERTNKKLSPVRRIYVIRLLGRSIVFLLCIFAAVFLPEQFIVLSGWSFFTSFSVLHLLWFLWVVDMLLQILPVRNYLPLGAQKQFAFRYRKGFDSSKEDIRAHSIKENKSAYGVMLLWIFFNLIPAVLHRNSLVSDRIMLLISVGFYVCDLVCVLIWCPFRLMLGNRCCTTCRIFNWDHMMMFTPLLLVGGFFSISLFLMSLIVWIVWELSIKKHPERFWERTNSSLRCRNCTDKLCIQYCEKRK